MDDWVGVLPFFIVYIIGIALMMVFPQIAGGIETAALAG
jgi:TRAP-type mannitol/chloroaromatic compound transport system permease large subunit